MRFGARCLCAGALLLLLTGCVVPQPRGAGQLSRKVEPLTRRGYWQYLPKDYVSADEAGRRARRWPLVVTFHGMKPFDNARPQALEWQEEADRYGFVVIAPELRAPDVLHQFPVRTVHSAFRSDEEAILAILQDVFTNTHADASNVLATSWSSGGYTAHYMLNQHPRLFTCLAVRQSNFSASILNAAMTERSRYHPILVVMTEKDFANCKHESRLANQWYKQHGYVNAGWIEIKRLGHARTPDLAADFFGRVSGVRPQRPPTVLVKRQAIDGNPEGLAFFSGDLREFQRPPTVARSASTIESLPETPARPRRIAASSTGSARRSQPRVSRVSSPAVQIASRPRTPRRAAPRPAAERRRTQVRIRASSVIGLEPLYLNFSAECPSEWHRTAEFLWTLDGNPVCKGVNGQKTVADAGEHTLGLLVVTRDGVEHRTSKRIRVLPRLDSTGTTTTGSR